MSRSLVRRGTVEVLTSGGSRALTSRELAADVAAGAQHSGVETSVAAQALVATGRRRAQQHDGFTVLEQVPGCLGPRTVRRVVVNRYCTLKID